MGRERRTQARRSADVILQRELLARVHPLEPDIFANQDAVGLVGNRARERRLARRDLAAHEVERRYGALAFGFHPCRMILTRSVRSPNCSALAQLGMKMSIRR